MEYPLRYILGHLFSRETTPEQGQLQKLDVEAHQLWGEAESRMQATKKGLSSLTVTEPLLGHSFGILPNSLMIVRAVLLLGSLAVKII